MTKLTLVAALDVHERFVLQAALAPLRERRANLVATGSPVENVICGPLGLCRRVTSNVAYLLYPKETAKLIEEAATSAPVHQ